MKNSKKTLLGVIGAAAAVVLLSGCTASFCSETDKAAMVYPYERGVTLYVDKPAYDAYFASFSDPAAAKADWETRGLAGQAFASNPDIFYYVPYEVNDKGYEKYTAMTAVWGSLNSIVDSAYSQGYPLPTPTFWAEIDKLVLEEATKACFAASGSTGTIEDFKASIKITSDPEAVIEGAYYVNPYVQFDTTGGEDTIAIEKSILRSFGHLKFGTEGEDSMWGRYETWYKQLVEDPNPLLGPSGCMSIDFYNLYKQTISQKGNSFRACSTISGGKYGAYGPSNDWTVDITKKDWGYAWSKGFLEGLLVYPVSWLVDTFAMGMDPALSGVGQIWALIFVTLIVRVLLLSVTFKSTLDSQKMQMLQPQLAKIQAKYPNSNTNQAEKSRMAQEQAALYKRNKINPLGQILMLFVQFPVFICVWSGLQGSAALSTGSFLHLNLSATIQSVIFNFSGSWYLNTTGWWTALILFLLMAGSQVMSMLLPKLLQKRLNKKISKMGKNPAQDSQNKTMKWVTIFMMGFTIVMGFFLPSAMGVYWLIGGIIGMAQTLITHFVMAKNAKKKGL